MVAQDTEPWLVAQASTLVDAFPPGNQRLGFGVLFLVATSICIQKNAQGTWIETQNILVTSMYIYMVLRNIIFKKLNLFLSYNSVTRVTILNSCDIPETSGTLNFLSSWFSGK